MRLTLAFLILMIPAGAMAQDGFGRAVAVSGETIAVVKPDLDRGLSAAIVFGRAGGEWREVARLHPINGGPGERFSASLAFTSDALVVAAGDPDGVWAANVFLAPPSSWRPALRVPRMERNGAAAPALDLAGIMRLAAPPARAVAISADGSVLAFAGGGSGGPELIVMEQRGGEWTETARLALEGDIAGPPVLAAARDRIAVATGNGVAILEHNGATWHVTTTLPDRPRALAIDGDAVLLGLTDQVLVRRPVTGAWEVVQQIEAQGLGSLALHGDELWIGKPSMGGVQRWVRAGDRWRFGNDLDVNGAPRGAGVGASIAASEGIVVAGAPGEGAAYVWRRSGDAWEFDGRLVGTEPLVEVTGEVRCADGAAAGFDCANVDLLAFLPLASMGAEPWERVSDLWGWTDRETGREYALVGRTAGIALVDVTDPASPRYLGLVPGNPSGARDVKVYRDHMFFTGDGAGAHGLVVFDLTRLRTITSAGVHRPDTVYTGIASAHNLAIETETGLAIPVAASAGGNTCGGGLHMVDITEPRAPTFAGCYTDTEGLIAPGRTHDAQCVIYRGPDAEHRGKRICFASNETALRIVDVTDAGSPKPISKADYPGRGYIHQGWLTEDQRYFFLDDELDELVGTTTRTKTLVWDVADLDDPVIAGELLGPDGSTDHNLFIRGDRMYLANYHAGLRVVDISDPTKPVEIGHFDTTPYGSNPTGFFGGAWTAYPFLESGAVLVSSINEGLFILRPRGRPIS